MAASGRYRRQGATTVGHGETSPWGSCQPPGEPGPGPSLPQAGSQRGTGDKEPSCESHLQAAVREHASHQPVPEDHVSGWQRAGEGTRADRALLSSGLSSCVGRRGLTPWAHSDLSHWGLKSAGTSKTSQLSGAQGLHRTALWLCPAPSV